MRKSSPLVSLCIPTYRRAGFIGQTLQSAIDQTIKEIEIIVVDDCSPDDTHQVVNRFDDPRIRYFRNKNNLGVPENLNRAISFSQGTYVVLLEDHDLLESNYLEETLKIMDRYPSVGFVATGLFVIDDSGNPIERNVENLSTFMEGRKLMRRLLTRLKCPFPVTTVIRKAALEEVDPVFDAKYWWYADQYLWLRLSAKSDFGYVARPLLKFRTREMDHYLVNRHWESYLCLDRIHRDNWQLLHPNPTLKSGWDRILYEKSKLLNMAMFRTSRILRGETWSQKDDRFAQSFLSPLCRLILSAVGYLPHQWCHTFRAIYRFYHNRRTKPDRSISKIV